VAFGQVLPTTPSTLSLVLTAPGGRDSPVVGFYRTPNGRAGQIKGQLAGTLDAGTFTGVLTADTAECIAEREYSGSLDAQFLRWTGGNLLEECKGDPFPFNSLMMLASMAPPPTSTVMTTSIMPVQCTYSLSSNGASVLLAGGQSTVGLITGPTCGWVVQNFVDWITVQPTSGTGPGTIVITVRSTPGPPRSATIVIAGAAFVVNQVVSTTTTTTSIIPSVRGGK
jgi:hypothetical protein